VGTAPEEIPIHPSNAIVETGAGLDGYVPCGLQNIGNTCFMNSILQCVMASPYLHEYFRGQFKTDKHLRKSKLADAYRALIEKVRGSGNMATVTPSDLKREISRTVSQFNGYAQHDAQEFLHFLLDRMHDELNRVKKKPKPYEVKCEK